MGDQGKPSDGEDDAVLQATGLSRTFFLRQTEIFVWLIFSGFIIFFSLIDALKEKEPQSISKVAVDNAGLIAFGIFVGFFPILFMLIFGNTPFEALRNYFGTPVTGKFEYGRKFTRLSGGIVDVDIVTDFKYSIDRINTINPRELMAFYTERTSEITRSIYVRAGVYLLVGVLISFTGLGFFYVRSIQGTGVLFREAGVTITGYSNTVQTGGTTGMGEALDRFLSLLPGFGILFFIEFIALFFLRQYRSAMDEFRYFDAVRRNREENLVILKMFAENQTVVSTKDVLETMRIYSSGGLLKKNQTTDLLESRRLQKDDIIIFEKLLDAVSALKDIRAAPGGSKK